MPSGHTRGGARHEKPWNAWLGAAASCFSSLGRLRPVGQQEAAAVERQGTDTLQSGSGLRSTGGITARVE
ncbi:hypothetical protein [Rathayibacter toxicus]|uniref:Uncharacterized protein n=1 Tax=Rathayibacter toxicus TaxID=145458 RepID=A0A2S5Y5S3_9MICO|nr:hypothetical protein [Rathayibacter toxicus]PPH57149.1 hypothetical protein C5D30_07155 [Rathayibacter toxicus]PPI14347.1 hypothetical protein C5C51_07145 [Rathayibacter toxicus]QWL48903.1 hypothetical protein E2R43_04240 [Rathayibacter toxicus]QWL53301.1 hypothetical protein E2R45_04245 [Rathayibacter toxicus]